MRQIGHLASEPEARAFGDFLYVQGIGNQIDREAEGWAVWISDEDEIERAAGFLAEFRKNPSDPRYSTQSKAAAQMRAAKEKDETAYRQKLKSRRHLLRPMSGYGFGPLTFGLIVASVVVFLLSKAGNDQQAIMGLFITKFDTMWNPSLPEIRHGEIWRLFTPIFIHYGYLHILFNMWCLRDVGSMIEARQSSLYLAMLVVVIAGTSNFAQVMIAHSPAFGGMSGVVYGLLGYIWIRGKFDPGSGLFLHPSTVSMMLIWFFACLVGVIPGVANIVHAVGLGVGMAWGYLSSLRYR